MLKAREFPKYHLLDVSKIPLTPPNVDMATKMGMANAIRPYIRSAKVCIKKLTIYFHLKSCLNSLRKFVY